MSEEHFCHLYLWTLFMFIYLLALDYYAPWFVIMDLKHTFMDWNYLIFIKLMYFLEFREFCYGVMHLLFAY